MSDTVTALEILDAQVVLEPAPPKGAGAGAVTKAAPPQMGPMPADLAELKVISAQASCRELIFELGMKVSLAANRMQSSHDEVKWLDKARAVDLSLEETMKVMKWGHYKWV